MSTVWFKANPLTGVIRAFCNRAYKGEKLFSTLMDDEICLKKIILYSDMIKMHQYTNNYFKYFPQHIIILHKVPVCNQQGIIW